MLKIHTKKRSVEEFNKTQNNANKKYKNKQVETKGLEQVRKEKEEYMKQYRAKKKREEAIIKIQNAFRNRIAIQEAARRYLDKNLPNTNQFLNKNLANLSTGSYTSIYL